MSYSPTLGRWMEADPLGYPDGGNRYQALSSGVTRHVDPLGLLAVDTDNPDIRSAFNKMENSIAAQRLLSDINRLENCAGKQVRIILTPSRNATSRTVYGNNEIQVWIQPYDQEGAFPNGDPSHNVITGPNPEDVQIGTELDALLYHELEHALLFLMQDCAKKHCIDVGGNSQDEERRATREENEYRREKGYNQRYSYEATDAQNEYIRDRLGEGVRGKPISPPPKFRRGQGQQHASYLF
jgi:hypothetical protein